MKISAARNINYYYTKKRYNWNPTDFSNVTAAFGIFQVRLGLVTVSVRGKSCLMVNTSMTAGPIQRRNSYTVDLNKYHLLEQTVPLVLTVC